MVDDGEREELDRPETPLFLQDPTRGVLSPASFYRK
jgi:hypothetical protein